MSFVLMSLAVVAVMLFVGWPLYRPRSEPEAEGDALSPLERRKLEAYAAIREAEFDLRMGKLSEVDFAAIQDRYRQQALDAIAALEKAKEAATLAPRPAKRAGKQFGFCPDCGRKATPRANFCGGCGRSLHAAVA
jgi:hypothetical protein